MPERASTLVTMLFTDLVSSTELLSRAGDEEAQRIFRAHHTLLAETAAAHGGAEVKWLGDGLMAAFSSAADAVRCAIAMQQVSRRPVAGERLAIRVGLNAGEALRDEADYFGTPVVVARRLCDRASGGQILCSELVAGLLAGRATFDFASLGTLELKGVSQPVVALEVVYEEEAIPSLVGSLPFVGRQTELSRLLGMLGEAAAGHGGLAFVVGEPGIGKTRLTEELADMARRNGVAVLWGHCLDGDWAPPYAPFVEAVEVLAGAVAPEELRVDLGSVGPALSQLVPVLREHLPDLPDAAPLQPDEERFRILDAMAQLLIARTHRSPLLLCLDDLHWADRSTVAMLRHLARSASGHRLFVVGTYRDAEVGAGHPLTEALGALRREVEFERLKLEGLEAKAMGELLEALAELDVVGSVAAAIAAETDGNPFFIKEVLRHLLEEGRLVRVDGRWTADRPVAELGIPEGVREVIDRRLARLSAEGNKLLSAASIFEGEIRLDVAAAVAGLDEEAALDALDEALDAQLLQSAREMDVYAFTHAIIRHTLADKLSPSRRGRLHLRAAEALENASEPSPARAGEIASQYHRAAGLVGAERGVDHALVAAAHAGAMGAHGEAARFIRVALDLLPKGDPRRPRLLSRLGMVLAWALVFDEAVAVASDAADALAKTEGDDAAVGYLADAAHACGMAGSNPHAWLLARQGLAGRVSQRDVAWALLVTYDAERRAAEDPKHPGIADDTPERREAAAIIREARLDALGIAPMEAVFDSREEALASGNLIVRVVWGGEYAQSLPLLQAEAESALAEGRLARAARGWFVAAYCCTGLGQLGASRHALDRAQELADRLGMPMFALLESRARLYSALGETDQEVEAIFQRLAEAPQPAFAWGLGLIYGRCAASAAWDNQAEDALQFIELLVPWLERAPAWTVSFPVMAHQAAEALWLLERTEHLGVIEGALRDKVVAPDFRSPGADGRVAVARLCALTGRHDEAQEWFAEARRVLTEQGARPLLANADYDEALMYIRRAEPADLDRARPLLDAARSQFEDLGMTGWFRRADELHARLR
jgi:class 3 adenylate cyclase/tetratricopeptide (TPR) repeat protein